MLTLLWQRLLLYCILLCYLWCALRLGRRCTVQRCVRVRVRETEAAWTCQSELRTPVCQSFFSFSFCKSLTPSRSPSFSPAACSFHRRAGSEFPSSRHNRWSSLDGASMRCHKFWKPCSLGFYIWIIMLFRGRFWGKVVLPLQFIQMILWRVPTWKRFLFLFFFWGGW